jgi:TatD DNase family protein
VFDSHAHLQDERIADPAAVWERARAAGVRRVVLAGVDAADWTRQAALATLPGVAQSVGVHPQIVAALDAAGRERELHALEQALSTRTSNVVAVGEIGMDGVGDRRASYDAQAGLFEEQLRVAIKHDLPVILHVLRAHEEALRVLARVGVPKAGGVVHSYSGSPELVPRYLEHGLYLSFSGSLTWHEGGRAARAVRACPRERLLVETDAPDQTPREQRPATNEPAFLGTVVDAVAGILDAPVADIAALTYENACRLFRIEDS